MLRFELEFTKAWKLIFKVLVVVSCLEFQPQEKRYISRGSSKSNDNLNQANYSVFHRPAGKINADSALEFLWQIDEDNCKNFKRDAEELNLKGDISWGAEKQFENEALMAVRTANFLSAFLQVTLMFY